MSSVQNILMQHIKRLPNYKTTILWIIVLLVAVFFIFYVIKKADLMTHGFVSYYTASKLLSEGEDVSNFYDDEWFNSRVKNYVTGVHEIYDINLPTTSLLMYPLSGLGYTSARIVWTVINFILLVVAIWFLIKSFQFSKEKIPIVIILFLCFQPLYANVAYAQAYVLIFFLLVLAWYNYKSSRDGLLGFLIGLMFLLKTAGFILLILLLIQKKWKAIFYASATIIFFILISLPVVGIDSWFAYAEKISGYTSKPELSVTAYQTIHGFFYHLTSYDPKWNPEPLINSTILGEIFTIIISTLILAASCFYTFKSKRPELSFAVFVAVSVILNPLSLDYHFIVLLLPVLIFIKWLADNQSDYSMIQKKILWTLLIIFYCLLAVRLPYGSPKLAGGWLAIFAYPKFYGALGLLGLFFWISLRDYNAPQENVIT